MKKSNFKKQPSPAENAEQKKAVDHVRSTTINNSSERWLDKQDIMQMMHISSRTLQNWRSKGLLRYAKVGGKIYYPESALQELLLTNLH